MCRTIIFAVYFTILSLASQSARKGKVSLDDLKIILEAIVRRFLTAEARFRAQEFRMAFTVENLAIWQAFLGDFLINISPQLLRIRISFVYRHSCVDNPSH